MRPPWDGSRQVGHSSVAQFPPGLHVTASRGGATVCQTCKASTAKSALKTTGRSPAGKAASPARVTPSDRPGNHVTHSMASVNASKCPDKDERFHLCYSGLDTEDGNVTSARRTCGEILKRNVFLATAIHRASTQTTHSATPSLGNVTAWKVCSV